MNRGGQAGRCFVVGGHSRGVGKTALAVALVRAVGPRPVVTVKVSAHRHGGGQFAIEEDAEPTLATSTGRCLAAGAARAFLCRCPDGHLHEVAALVRVLSSSGYDVVAESNRMAPPVAADLTLFVTSSDTPDWKASSALSLTTDRADRLWQSTPRMQRPSFAALCHRVSWSRARQAPCSRPQVTGNRRRQCYAGRRTQACLLARSTYWTWRPAGSPRRRLPIGSSSRRKRPTTTFSTSTTRSASRRAAAALWAMQNAVVN